MSALVNTERDAQIMELRMRGFEVESYVNSGSRVYCVPDRVSGVHDTEEEAWDAAIKCAKLGWKPYGIAVPPDDD